MNLNSNNTARISDTPLPKVCIIGTIRNARDTIDDIADFYSCHLDESICGMYIENERFTLPICSAFAYLTSILLVLGWHLCYHEISEEDGAQSLNELDGDDTQMNIGEEDTRSMTAIS